MLRSVRSAGVGGPDVVLCALREVFGPAGTVMMLVGYRMPILEGAEDAGAGVRLLRWHPRLGGRRLLVAIVEAYLAAGDGRIGSGGAARSYLFDA